MFKKQVCTGEDTLCNVKKKNKKKNNKVFSLRVLHKMTNLLKFGLSYWSSKLKEF